MAFLLCNQSPLPSMPSCAAWRLTLTSPRTTTACREPSSTASPSVGTQTQLQPWLEPLQELTMGKSRCLRAGSKAVSLSRRLRNWRTACMNCIASRSEPWKEGPCIERACNHMTVHLLEEMHFIWNKDRFLKGGKMLRKYWISVARTKCLVLHTRTSFFVAIRFQNLKSLGSLPSFPRGLGLEGASWWFARQILTCWQWQILVRTVLRGNPRVWLEALCFGQI